MSPRTGTASGFSLYELSRPSTTANRVTASDGTGPGRVTAIFIA